MNWNEEEKSIIAAWEADSSSFDGSLSTPFSISNDWQKVVCSQINKTLVPYFFFICRRRILWTWKERSIIDTMLLPFRVGVPIMDIFDGLVRSTDFFLPLCVHPLEMGYNVATRTYELDYLMKWQCFLFASFIGKTGFELWLFAR